MSQWCGKCRTTHLVACPRGLGIHICGDCGKPLGADYDVGDVCSECFAKFEGMTLEQIVDAPTGPNDPI